ncbi:ABC transporter permease, partial [Arachidicoccus sp.]|uniref:ABC transporter permease n=1 Tax=Arachidicoccus sp. TaxID=1872624 RepID=UPI003D26163D
MEEHNKRSRSVFKRLLKNKGAFFGLIIISFSIFISVFAYLLAPDSSPNCNRMTTEIANQRPGFSMEFLRLKKERNAADISFFHRLLFGKEVDYQLLPIVAYQKNDSGYVIKKYIDEGVSETLFFSANKVMQPAVSKETFYLGTDKFGRDIVSRLLLGTRVSLAVGLIAVFLSLTLGVFLGAIAGYFGGRVDNFVLWLINVIWSIPTLLLVFAITLLLGKGFWQVFVAVGLTLWVSVARLVRGQVLAIKKLEYIEAAKVLGFSNSRIIIRHIIPNIVGPVMVIAASNFASAIVIEAGLSFLGLGVQPPQPSWGLMIKENYN